MSETTTNCNLSGLPVLLCWSLELQLLRGLISSAWHLPPAITFWFPNLCPYCIYKKLFKVKGWNISPAVPSSFYQLNPNTCFGHTKLVWQPPLQSDLSHHQVEIRWHPLEMHPGLMIQLQSCPGCTCTLYLYAPPCVWTWWFMDSAKKMYWLILLAQSGITHNWGSEQIGNFTPFQVSRLLSMSAICLLMGNHHSN